MNRIELLSQVRDTLISAGFYVSDLVILRPIGFDLVARRDNSLLIIKVLTNIDSMTEDVSNELRTLSELIKGCPLIIGLRSGTGYLEEDVVYDRFGIKVINPNTLKNHLLEGIPLEIYASPGGFCVNINKDKLKDTRQKQNLSIGSFARELKVSRRTVQMYEEGMNASVEVALRIENILGAPIAEPIDIFKGPKKVSITKKRPITPETESFRQFQGEVFDLIKQLGYKVIPMERAPFEAVSQEKKKILLTCVDRYDKKLIKKAKVVSSISKITEKHAVLITDKNVNKTNIEGTPLVVKKELKKTKDPEDLIELILERLYNNDK